MERQTESKTEKEYWQRFLNKYVSLVKQLKNGKDLYYNGRVVEVFEHNLILDDRKLGEIPITFQELNIIGWRD